MSENNASLPRYDFVYLFDVTDGNPNGDPDAGNLPRVDPETGQGLVTDVCLTRKVRNFIGLTKGNGQPPEGFHIYVREKAVLNQQHDLAWQTVMPDATPADKKKLPRDAQKAKELTAWMCRNFYDIRTFGAVMTTEVNCGQVRGPIQFVFGRSVDPVFSQEHAITVCAARKSDKPIEEQIGIQGRKFTVPYGLYRVHGFFNPFLAAQTGFSTDDLELFKQALGQMFEFDRSAARGQMVPRRCITFRHESSLGNARADQLFDRVRVILKPELTDAGKPPRKFGDYNVQLDDQNLPAGITVEEWV